MTSNSSRAAVAKTLHRRFWQAGLAASLLLSCSPMALHAETSNAELAKEIAELKAQIREMKGALSETRSETRRTSAKVRAVAERGPTVLPPPGPPIPYGAVPAFVTSDKKLQFGAITITPGGFIAAESVFRSRNLQSDMISNLGGIPFPNTPLAATNEFRPSARQSRVALLAEAPISQTMIAAGYAELDFLGAASTANENQTNSYTPRIRNLYATLDNSEYGMHVLAGQNWSLVTLNTKGITPRNELTPNVIDAQQTVGSLYARQAQIRLVKDFNKTFWGALSVEEGQTTGCPTPATPSAFASSTSTQALNGVSATCGAVGTGGSFVGAAQSGPFYSLDHLPDVIGKVAYEGKIADRDVHLEALGVYTDLYDRVTNTTVVPVGAASNKDTSGYGVGGGLVTAIVPKRLDFQVNGIYGRGINRYGAAGLPDATFNGDGSLRPIEGYVALAGLTFHATPSIDIYGYAGVEGEKRSFTASNAAGTTFVGIGAPTTNDSGCFVEGGTCSGSTKRIFELTGGFWDKVYKGSFGEVRVGAQYAFLQREIFNSNNPANPVAGPITSPFYTPKTTEHIVMTSLRYFPFAADAAAPPPVVAKY